jgi:hypothetical protein
MKLITSIAILFLSTMSLFSQVSKNNTHQSLYFSEYKIHMDESSSSEQEKSESYYGIVNFGFLSGPMIDGSAKSIFSFSTIHGIQFDNFLCTGIGFGIERYPNITFTPIFFDLRAYIINGNISPLLFVDLGYSSTTDKKGSIQSGGMMLHVGTGVKVSISDDISVHLNLGYKNQKMEVYSLFGIYNSDVDLLAVSLGIGF